MDNGNQESVSGATIPIVSAHGAKPYDETPGWRRPFHSLYVPYMHIPTYIQTIFLNPPQRTDTFFSLAIDHRLDPRQLRAPQKMRIFS